MGMGMIGAQPAVGGIFGGSGMGAGGGLDIFGGLGGVGGTAPNAGIMFQGGPIALPKQEWLPASRGKGMEMSGTFVRRGGQIYADMTFTNKALQGIGNFAIQFNKNRYITSYSNTSTSTHYHIMPPPSLLSLSLIQFWPSTRWSSKHSYTCDA